MSVVDEIAALPRGGTLAAIAAEVLGGPADVSALATSWTKAASDTEESTAAFRLAVSEVGQAWSGSSNAAFTDLTTEFVRASEATQRSLHLAAATVSQAAAVVEVVQTSIRSICENLLFQVSQVRQVFQAVAPGYADFQIGALVDGATHLAQAVMTTYGGANDQVSVALSHEMPGLGPGTGFLALPRMDDAGSEQVFERLSTSEDTDTVFETLATDAGAETLAFRSGVPANVDAWVLEARRILLASGVPESKLDTESIKLIIEHESSGDPMAVNNWDSNAAAGTPSIGLMQTIRPTFDAYALPGHDDIENPVDNIIAGTRYALARYGSLDVVPGVAAVRTGEEYVGY